MDTPLLERFGRALRKRRTTLGFSQESFAGGITIGYGHIDRLLEEMEIAHADESLRKLLRAR